METGDVTPREEEQKALDADQKAEQKSLCDRHDFKFPSSARSAHCS
jgi:hypothetical protein